ncbi:hypothetical protein [Campylobacter corcagiensis]|uniref:Uncharacterized protein n=1 Tax=Campylobacter corcagiensis TaxID=1448857 RepID=A0A7M1LED4_9BACT|nr:hypothetical protein [Campylobacter corcagiensis]QKF65174.1 hypothetical protein CCORG_1331 [Campylobacter corcagiensis]QOQ86683.1 hypothetical protein IMC76_05500 [Campylobacter corcagiensis]
MGINKNKKNDIMDIMINIAAGTFICTLVYATFVSLLPTLYDAYDAFTKTNNKKKSFETDKPNFIPQEFCSYFEDHEICKNICEYDYSSYGFLCDYSLTTQKQRDDMVIKLKEEYSSFKAKEEEKEEIKKRKNMERINNIPNIKI